MKKLFSLVNIPSSESETAQLVNTFLMSLSKRFQKESTRFLSCTGNLENSCSGASHGKSQHCMHCFWQCTCPAHAVWAYIGIVCEEVVIPSYAVVCQFLKFFSRCHDCWHRQMEGCHMTHTHLQSHCNIASTPHFNSTQAPFTPTIPQHPSTLTLLKYLSPSLYPSTPQPSLYPSTPQPSLYPSTPQPSLYSSTSHPHSTPAPLNPHSTPAPLNSHSTPAPLNPHSTPTPLNPHSTPAPLNPHSTPAPLNPHSTQAPLTPLYPSTPHPTLPSTPHPPAPPVAFGMS